MARKKTNLSKFDFSSPDNLPSWASSLREQGEKELNARREARSAVEAMRADGVSLAPDAEDNIYQQILETGDFDIPEYTPPVEEEAAPVEQDTAEEPISGTSYAGMFQPGLERLISAGSLANEQEALGNISERIATLKTEDHGGGFIRNVLKDTTGIDLDDPNIINPLAPVRGIAEIISPQLRKERLEAESRERQAEIARLTPIAQELQTSIKERQEELPTAIGEVAQAIGTVSAQPEQVLSLAGAAAGTYVGGPAGGIAGTAIGSLPMAKSAYDSSFSEALDLGATDEEAKQYAYAMTAAEFGTEVVGGGIASKAAGFFGLKKLGKNAVQDALAKRLRSRASRGIGASIAEGIGEAATTRVQDELAYQAEENELLSDPAAREKLRIANAERRATEAERMLDAGLAGAIGGGTIGGIGGAAQYGAEIANQEKGTTDAANRVRDELRRNEARRREAEEAQVTQDLAREEERIRVEQEREEAFRQAEEQRVREEQTAATRKADEEEAGFRTMETEREFQGQTRLERYAGVTERVPVNPPAETTPEQVAQEREQAEAAAREQEQQAERASLLDEIQKRQDAQRKAQTKKSKAEQTAAKKAEASRRKAILDKLVEENPDADPAQLLPLYEQRLAQPEPTPAPVEEVAPTTAPVVPARTATPARTGQVTTDQEIEDLRSGLGLQMAQTETTPAATPEETEARRTQVISNLVRANRNETADIQNLIRQEKLVVAANPEEIGRDDTGQASYDPTTGQMYIYTDRVDPNNAVGSIAASLHEATHAGQFNDREGRPSIFRQMMSQDRLNAASERIRTAAEQGNTLAQRAVTQAQEASPDTEVQDLELVPYFVSAVTESRGEPLGRVGGIVRDITGAARNFLRENLGMDLDVSMNDLAYASQRTAGELVQTDLAPTEGAALQIEAGRNARGFARAQARGETYEGESDFPDERFEVNDENAELEDESLVELQEDGASIPITDVLNHEELYEQYPQLRNYTVRLEDLAADTSGYHDIEGGAIVLNKQEARVATNGLHSFNRNAAKEKLRNVMLHELQHAVQEIEGWEAGANAGNFISRADRNALTRARERMIEVISNFDLGSAVSQLPPPVRRVWENEVKALGSQSRDQQAALFLDSGYYSDTADKQAKRYGENVYTDAAKQLAEANLRYETARTNAFRLYLRDRGEAAARNVEQRSRMTAAERAATPFNETLATDPLSRRLDVTRKDLLDTTPYVGGTRRPPQALQMAADSTGTSTQAFSSWFGSSVARNADGSPRRFFTGTSKDTNFTSFKVPKNGVWFTDDPSVASQYALENDSMTTVRDTRPGARPWSFMDVNTASRVFSVYLKAENPYMIQQADIDRMQVDNYRRAQGQFFDTLRAQGYDSVIFDGTVDDPKTLVIIGQPNQIKSVNNRGTFSNRGDILNMAAGADQRPVARRVPRPARNLLNLFDAALGVGADFNELIEFAASGPAEARMIAEGSLHRYNAALAKEAKKHGMSPDQLNEQIQKELDAAVKETAGYNENYAAFVDIAKKYGAPGQALIDMRNQIDSLTRDIVKARLAKGTKLSAKEKKLYETLINNLGRYTHRQYASMAGKMGDKFSQKVWDDYKKVKGDKKRANPEQLANYNRVANAVRYLVDNNLYIPDDETLNELTAERTGHLYDVWQEAGNPRNLTTEQMKEALAEARDRINGDTNRLEAVAEGITQELLGLTDPTKSIVSYFRGGKQDSGILRERQNVPVELRELMGEIKDPAMRMMLTVAKQAEFVARNKMLLEISNKIGDQVQPPDAVGTPEAEGLEQLQGEGWGPLEGYYVSRELKNRLSDAVLQLANFEQAVAMAGVDATAFSKLATNSVVNAWGKVAGTSKALQIIGKPVNFLYNYLGAYRQLIINGNLDPRTWAKAHKAAVELIDYARSPKNPGRLAVEANKYGITDSAFIGELRSGQYKELSDLVKKMAGMSPSQSFNFIRKQAVGAKELYAMMDVWSKIANFYHEVDVLTNYYKAADITRTTEEIKREAADRANRTNITYKRAAPLIKGAEKMGVTAFATYFYEVFRSELGNAYQGVQDIRAAANAPNAKARTIMASHAAARLSGQMASWYLTAEIAKALAKEAFGDDEDDQDKRYLLPEWMRNQDFISLGKDEKGNAVFWDVSRIDPVGPLTDLMRASMLAESGRELESIADRIMELYVAPRILPQLATALGATFVPEVKPTRKPMIDITDLPFEDRKEKAWANVAETFLPGIVSGYRENNAVPVPNDLPSSVGAMMVYGGASFYKLDPKQPARTAVFNYNDATKFAKRDFGDILRDNAEQGLTGAELADKLGAAQQREEKAFRDLYNVYKGMKAVGMSEREITAMLKDIGLSVSDIKAIKTGEFKSKAISEKTIESKMKQEMIGASKAEKAEIREKWDNIRLMIKSEEE